MNAIKCTHPAIIDDKCLVCGAKVANTPPVTPDGEIVEDEPETPEKPQETPKKGGRKSTAK